MYLFMCVLQTTGNELCVKTVNIPDTQDMVVSDNVSSNLMKIHT